MVNLRELEAFRAVMATGTTIGASKTLNLSQPSVSRLLADLETRLGLVLFRRERGRLIPTQDAYALINGVEHALESLNQLTEFTGHLRRSPSRSVRLLVPASLTYRFALHAIASLAKMHPNVLVSVRLTTTEMAVELIASEQADVAVSLLPAGHPGIIVAPLLDVPIVCMLPARHRLSTMNALSPKDLNGEPLILGPRQYAARVRIDEAFEQAGIEAEARLEIGSIAVASGCVEMGLGIALVNAFGASEFASRDLVLRRFEPLIRNSFGVLLSKKSPSRVVVDLIASLRGAALDQVGGLTLNEGHESTQYPAMIASTM